MITLSPPSRLLCLRLAFIAMLISTLACSLAGPAPVISSSADGYDETSYLTAFLMEPEQ